MDSVMISVVRFGEGNPAFSPTILLGSSDQKIELVIENQTAVPHNFSTVDGSIDQELTTETIATVTAKFPKDGSLFFYCKYHLQDRQIGALETINS